MKSYWKHLAAVALLLTLYSPVIATPVSRLKLSSDSLELHPLLIGRVSLRSGMGCFVTGDHLKYSKPMRTPQYKGILPEVRADYNKNPNAEDLYLIMTQLDPSFRKLQWDLLGDKENGTRFERLRRGITLFYRHHEWEKEAYKYPDVYKLVDEAIKELETCWRNQPSVVCGAVLMAAYDEKNRKLPLAFTEEFLRWAEPVYTYRHFLRARNADFLGVDISVASIPKDKWLLVQGIFAARWSLLASGKKRPGAEAVMLDAWLKKIEKAAGVI